VTAEETELVAALRSLVSAHQSCKGWGDQPHGGWTKLDKARERVRAADAAIEAMTARQAMP
jgi:hypothetical protein